MTRPAAEPATTPEGSRSQTPQPPSSTQPSRVTPPMLGVGTSGPQTPSTSTASTPPPFPGGGSDDELLDPLGADPFSTDTRSSAEDRRAAGGKKVNLKKQPLEDSITGGVMAASEGVHNALARTPAEQAEELWRISTEDEAKPISEPISSILRRRMGDAVVTPDIGDLIDLGVAVIAYLSRNAMRALQLRRAQRNMRLAGLIPNGEESTDTQGDS